MRQPTLSMTEFATKIAIRHCIIVPASALVNFEMCRKFIDDWAKKPTSKQISMLKRIADKEKTIIPEKAFGDIEVLNHCLDVFQTTKKPLETSSPGNTNIVKVNTYLDPRVFKHGLKNKIITDKLKLIQVGPRVEYFYLKAESQYGKKFVRPTVDFNLLGAVAGCAFSQENRLQFNLILITENWPHFWDNAIPHQVAHLVCATLHGLQASLHGKEWKAIMVGFGCKPERGHNMDVGRAQVRRKKS